MGRTAKVRCEQSTDKGLHAEKKCSSKEDGAGEHGNSQPLFSCVGSVLAIGYDAPTLPMILALHDSRTMDAG